MRRSLNRLPRLHRSRLHAPERALAASLSERALARLAPPRHRSTAKRRHRQAPANLGRCLVLMRLSTPSVVLVLSFGLLVVRQAGLGSAAARESIGTLSAFDAEG